jgi:Zn-finger protein
MKKTEEHKQKPDWHGKHYSFFKNKDCEYSPCHTDADSTEFNCLFCYCPLYALGRNCGGNYTYRENGLKGCSSCLLPHKRENYGYILSSFGELAKVAQGGTDLDSPIIDPAKG